VITNVYIDGFNLYYGIRRWPGCKWLDVGKLVTHLFPNDQIHRIRYFTAHVKGKSNPGAPERQQAYLRALKTIEGLEIHYGRFLVTPTTMQIVKPNGQMVPFVKVEEKGSDVNLATYLMLDAFTKDCEMAIVISNDSDLVEPIRLAQAPPFNLHVWAVNPHPKPTAMGSMYQLTLKRSVVEASKFPPVVHLPNGKKVTCPSKWGAAKTP
jgi:uncharacterized LabA/DUF88 family protein